MSSDVLEVLQTFYRESLGRLLRHQAGARVIRQYDANNTYQYVINREEAHLSWLGTAIRDLGGATDDREAATDRIAAGKDAARTVMQEDAREAAAFVERWRPRIESLANARHAKMLDIILGEVLEQQRFFEQGAAGRTDLLGQRAAHLEPAAGEVLPERWRE